MLKKKIHKKFDNYQGGKLLFISKNNNINNRV